MKIKSIVTGLLLLAMTCPASAGSDNPVVIIIKDYKFIPQQVTIKPGQTVRWENHEKRQYHSVWFEALGEDEPEDYLFPDDSYERSFETPGEYPYQCGPHPEMTASITVAE